MKNKKYYGLVKFSRDALIHSFMFFILKNYYHISVECQR